MENSTSPKNGWIEKKFDKVDEQIDKISDDMSEIKSDVSVLFTMVESFKGLPETMNKLNETLIGFKGEMNLMNHKLVEIDKKNTENKQNINCQKERGKIDIILWLSKHWWKILFGGATLLVIFKDYII